MLWHLDAGWYERGLELANYLARHQLALPERYKRNLATLLLDEVAGAIAADAVADPERAVALLQRQTVDQQNGQLALLRQTIASQGQAMGELHAAQECQRLDLIAVTQRQNGFRTALAARAADLERLKHEHDDIRRWADTALPDPVIGLRARPALTGADAHAEYLRTRDPVPPAREPGAHPGGTS